MKNFELWTSEHVKELQIKIGPGTWGCAHQNKKKMICKHLIGLTKDIANIIFHRNWVKPTQINDLKSGIKDAVSLVNGIVDFIIPYKNINIKDTMMEKYTVILIN